MKKPFSVTPPLPPAVLRSLDLEPGASEAQVLAALAAMREAIDQLTHQVICCGVAASHPDATLTTRGAYAGKWNSRQADEVRALRQDRDRLRAELESLKAAAG